MYYICIVLYLLGIIYKITYNTYIIYKYIIFVVLWADNGQDKITALGPGIDHGILPNFDGRFDINTEDAGSGECEVKIKGPKGNVTLLSMY